MWPCQSIFLPTENYWPGSNWSIGGGGRRRFRSARRRWSVLSGSATAGSRGHGGGRRGRGHDVVLIREHAPGDSARHVDWKATAKTGVLKVREFTREDERKLRIVFDNPAPGAVSEAAYEASVSLAASLAWHFAQSDAQLSFAGQSYGGSEDVYDFLSHLATVTPPDGASLLDDLAVSDDYNVILTARPQGSIPTRLWACSYFLFMHEKEAAVL